MFACATISYTITDWRSKVAALINRQRHNLRPVIHPPLPNRPLPPLYQNQWAGATIYTPSSWEQTAPYGKLRSYHKHDPWIRASQCNRWIIFQFYNSDYRWATYKAGKKTVNSTYRSKRIECFKERVWSKTAHSHSRTGWRWRLASGPQTDLPSCNITWCSEGVRYESIDMHVGNSVGESDIYI